MVAGCTALDKRRGEAGREDSGEDTGVLFACLALVLVWTARTDTAITRLVPHTSILQVICITVAFTGPSSGLE